MRRALPPKTLLLTLALAAAAAVCCVSAHAQVTLDVNSGSHTASASSINWTHAVGSSATNVVLLVAVSINGNPIVNSVTWSGTNPTFSCLAAVGIDSSGGALGSCGSAGSGTKLRRTEIWGAVVGTPATKSGTVTVTLSASTAVVAGSVSFYNAAQSSAFGTGQTTVGTSPGTASLTFSGLAAIPDTIVMDSFGINSSGSGTPGGTSLWGTGANGIWGGSSDKAGTSSIGMSETATGSNFGWAYAGVPINPLTGRRRGQVIVGRLTPIDGSAPPMMAAK